MNVTIEIPDELIERARREESYWHVIAHGDPRGGAPYVAYGTMDPLAAVELHDDLLREELSMHKQPEGEQNTD